jgi:hypothetical protein
MTTATTVTKRVMHNGLEIRRSNEMTNCNAYLHRTPLTWVLDDFGSKQSFNTLKLAMQFVDSKIAIEETKSYSDWDGNYWIVRPVDGAFSQVSITRDQHKAGK